MPAGAGYPLAARQRRGTVTATQHRRGKRAPLTVHELWRLERIGTPSLSPDGRLAVTAVTAYDMEDNRGSSALWLLSTEARTPRRLTRCGDKDGQPAFSPRGDLIAFIARRQAPGAEATEELPQLYLIAADGGEAWRAADVVTGVEAFRWCPDGRHVVLISWVWPAAATDRHQKAQAQAMAEYKAAKTSGIATSEGFYRWWDHMLPAGRAPHLLLLDTRSGEVRDLLAGSGLELPRGEPDLHCFDVSPDGRRVAFCHDPAPAKRADGRCALAEVDLQQRSISVLAQDPDWDYRAPRYSPDGTRLAFIAHPAAASTSAPGRVAVLSPGQPCSVASAAWDRDVQPPLYWDDDGRSLLLAAEEHGRRHVWRFDLATETAQVLAAGGWIAGFDSAAGVLLTLDEAADHPAQLHARRAGQPPLRIEAFNDALLARCDLGRHEVITVAGAQGEPVQVWLHYPPDFDARRRWPLLQVIHGGPHTAAGDNWHFRWNNKLLAGAGYVVALVNYHGSSGFGRAFADSIATRWGTLELQDLEAATDALLQRPWADPARVFAAGGSYGGYLVAWMNGHLPAGRYAGYVCHAGCWDWGAMFADDCWPWHRRDLGAWYWEDGQKVDAQSAHSRAATLTTPTLVVHGALDYRVPDGQGLAYYNTLKARGIDARLLWFPDENHWVLKPRNSRQWYAEVLAWLRHCDPAQAEARGAAATAPRLTSGR